jgi:hypothetical protein
VVLCGGGRVGADVPTAPSCVPDVRDDLFATTLPETGAGSQGFDVTSGTGGEYLVVAAAPGILANDETCGAVDVSTAAAIGCASGPVTVIASADGSFSLTLPAACSGVASVAFEYDLQGEGGTIGTATATVVVDPVTYFRLPDEAPTDGSELDDGGEGAPDLAPTGRRGSTVATLATCCLVAGTALTLVARVSSGRTRRSERPAGRLNPARRSRSRRRRSPHPARPAPGP